MECDPTMAWAIERTAFYLANAIGGWALAFTFVGVTRGVFGR